MDDEGSGEAPLRCVHEDLGGCLSPWDRSVAVKALIGLVRIHPVCTADPGGELPPCTMTRLVIVLATVTVTVTVV